MTNILGLVNFCDENTVETPFDGSYSRTSEIKNGRPVYQHALDYQVIWTGINWQFIDPSLEIGTMTDQDLGVQIYPENLHDWELVRDPLSPITYTDLLISCRKSNFSYFVFVFQYTILVQNFVFLY